MPPTEPGNALIVDGYTASGLHVRVIEHSQLDVTIEVDGEKATLIERPNLYRDGGTRRFQTDKGTLVLPRKIGNSDRTPRFNEEKVLPSEVEDG